MSFYLVIYAALAAMFLGAGWKVFVHSFSKALEHVHDDENVAHLHEDLE